MKIYLYSSLAKLLIITTTIFQIITFSDVSAQETLKIGCLAPLTGPLAQSGLQTLQGVEAAAEIINDRGGILGGKKIEIITGDTRTPLIAAREAERLIRVEGVKVITGGFSSARSYAASEITEKYKTIFWITTSVAANITRRGYKYLFRYNLPSTKYGYVKAVFINEHVLSALGKKPEDIRVAIIHEDTLFGTTIAKTEVSACRKFGFDIVMKERYDAKSVNLSPLIMKLMAVRPDVILITGYYNDTSLFYKQAKRMNFDIPVLIGSGAAMSEYQFYKEHGKDADYVTTITHQLVDPEKLNDAGKAIQVDLKKKFKEKYGMDRIGSASILAFEGAWQLFNYVLPKAGSLEPEAVRQAALSIDISWENSAIGIGGKYAPPGHPMAGTNLEAGAFLAQWMNGRQVIVCPDHLATQQPVIPMPTWNERKKSVDEE